MTEKGLGLGCIQIFVHALVGNLTTIELTKFPVNMCELSSALPPVRLQQFVETSGWALVYVCTVRSVSVIKCECSMCKPRPRK